jgi:hypothetical protein
MMSKFLLAACLALLAPLAVAQPEAETKIPDCSMERLEPLLANFVVSKAAYTSASAMSAADLASASAELAGALEECGLKPSCPDPLAPPLTTE